MLSLRPTAATCIDARRADGTDLVPPRAGPLPGRRRLFSPARYDGLPGLRFPGAGWSFPTKDEAADFVEKYARRFALPVRTGVRVDLLSRDGDRFIAVAGGDRFVASNVVVGGVLVAGAGNLGAEIALELSRTHRPVLLSGRDTGQETPFRHGSAPDRLITPPAWFSSPGC